MKYAEVAKLSDDELAKKLEEGRAELFNLRFQHVTGQLENPILLRQTRRDIARVKTIIREKEIAGSEG